METFNKDIVILRVRKGVPGIGRKLSRYYSAYEVTCKKYPLQKVPDNSYVLNYGRSEWPVWALDAMSRGVQFINTPTAVGASVNKVLTLKILSTNGVACVQWTTDYKQAEEWYMKGKDIVVRNTATGKQGNGIVLCSRSYPFSEGGSVPSQFKDAPLFTVAYDKDVEFRVHVVNGKVVDYVQKKRMGEEKRKARGLDEVDEFLRNHKRGWVFAHNNIIHSKLVKQLAIDTLAALGLDYGGVDILAKVNEEGDTVVDAVVCESNSAPSMSSSTTFKAYTEAFNMIISGEL